MSSFEATIEPAAFRRGAPLYLMSDVMALTRKAIDVSPVQYFTHKAKIMSAAVSDATEIVHKTVDEFEVSINRLLSIEERFAAKSKDVSARTRSSVQAMADGLRKIEGSANFGRLEQYVLLLERAAAAMSTLAELDRSGKLAKIAGALK